MSHTIEQAARALGVSPSTVRRDVAAGCDGIERLGAPGRNRGALLDLEQYRAWREGRDDERVLEILGDAAADVLREHGGQTRALRRHAAYIALALYVTLHQRVMHREPAELPAKLRAACAVCVDSTSRSQEQQHDAN